MLSYLTSLSVLLGNLVEQWTQATKNCPLGHVCTNCGGLCRSPQGDANATHDDHDVKGASFDDEAYTTYGGGSNEIDVELFVDIICGEGESQEKQVKI